MVSKKGVGLLSMNEIPVFRSLFLQSFVILEGANIWTVRGKNLNNGFGLPLSQTFNGVSGHLIGSKAGK